MRGQILDTIGLEAFVSLEDESIISLPIYKIGNSSIGDFVFISESSLNDSRNFKTTQYIDPIMRFF